MDYEDIYKEAVANASDDAHFVEVGSWKGRSAAFMAVEIKNSGKDIRFDCVDTWMGSEEHTAPKSVFREVRLADPEWLFGEFKANTKKVAEFINPIRSTSLDASGLYEDGSLDFVFIDAAHDYDSVISDIKAWMPKVKDGGVLCGHDYNLGSVKKAVDELLGGSFRVVGTSWVVD